MQADLKMNFFVEDLINLPKVRVRSVVREREAIFLQLGFREEEVACPHCGKRRANLTKHEPLEFETCPFRVNSYICKYHGVSFTVKMTNNTLQKN